MIIQEQVRHVLIRGFKSQGKDLGILIALFRVVFQEKRYLQIEQEAQTILNLKDLALGHHYVHQSQVKCVSNQKGIDLFTNTPRLY